VTTTRAPIAAARAGLCFLSRLNRDSYTRRCFEIPACGTVLVSERTDDLAALFRDGDEAVLFSTREELVKKVRWLAADAGAARRIAAAGRERVHRDGHGVDGRVQEWLDVVLPRLARVGATSMSRHAVHWTCWQPTPYNDLLFSSLAQAPEVGLLVHFREPHVPSHPWRSALAQGYASRVCRTTAGVDWTLIGLAARARRATFVFGGWDTPTAVLALLLLMARGTPYLVWTDTPNTTCAADR
jgi:hypothetical protein